MSLETEVKPIIGERPISYFKVEGACAYDDRDPLFDSSKGSRLQLFADAFSMAMVDYFHKGQSTPFAKDVLVAILIRLTDKNEKTELVHLRMLSDAYFASPTIAQFTENVVVANTRRFTHVCRKLMPAADLEKCEAVVFETTEAEFSKIVLSVGDSNTKE